MPRYKVLAKPKGRTLTLYKKRGLHTGYEVVKKGSGEGGGTRYFSSLPRAQHYARQLTSFTTKIVSAPVRKRAAKKQPSLGWGW